MKPFRCGNIILIILPFTLLFIVFISSCLKGRYDFDKITKTEWNPDFAIPIAYSKFTLRDLLRDYDSSEVVVEDPTTGFLSLIYNDTLYSVKASSLLNIPSQSFKTSYGVTNSDITILTSVQSVTVSDSDDYVLAVPTDDNGDTIQISTIRVKKGTFSLTVTNLFNHPGNLNITLPTVKSGSVVFTVNAPFSAQSTSTVPMNLDGYAMDLTKGGTPSIYNTLPVIATLQMTNSGASVTTADSLKISFDMQNMEYSYMDGYLGKWTLILPKDSVDLNLEIFNEFAGGSIEFEDPRITLHMENSYGIPIQAVFTQLYASSNQGNQTITLSPGIYPGSGVTLNYPSLSEVGQIKNTDMVFNTSTTNLYTVLSQIKPQYLFYAVNGFLNPLGGPAINFITDQSYFSVAVQIELPLWGTAGVFTLTDTVPFSLESVEDNVVEPTDSNETVQIEFIKFKLNVWNGFPLDVSLQVYFTDSVSPGNSFKKLDSLNNPYQEIIVSGTLDKDGRVAQPVHRAAEFYIDDARTKNVASADHMIVKATLSTTNGGQTPVKIYSDYNLLVKLGIRTKIKTAVFQP